MSRSSKCPVCRERVEETTGETQSRIYPFCSESCRDRDLGGWLQDQYRLGSRPLESDEVEGFTDNPGVD
ncbi:MAG: DNA gyrase inhibitor YacG [Planctomycetota bacterium]